MPIVLDEVAHAREAAQRSRKFVAMEATIFRESQWQITIAASTRSVDHGALWAVHRLQAELFTLRLDDEHVVAIEIPMARLLPEVLAHDDRGGDLLIAASLLHLAHRTFERAPKSLPLRVPEGAPGRDVVEREEVQRDAELAMIALARLIATPEVLVDLLLRLPCGAIDALQHRSIVLAAPVGPRNGEQLERTDLARALHVRPATEILEFAVLIRRNVWGRLPLRGGSLGEIVHDLDLEELVCAHQCSTLIVERVLGERERVVRGNALGHLGLNRGEIVWGQGSL